MHAIRRLLYNGPMGAFTKLLVYLHVGFHEYIAHIIPNYVHKSRRPTTVTSSDPFCTVGFHLYLRV
jgi:hypothetical protein